MTYSDDWLTILQGDCREVMATMEPESVHCVVTSPPYWGLRDYGTPGQLGLEPTPEAYVEDMVAVFREVRRVLRSDGTVWLNLGDSFAGSSTGADRPPEPEHTREANGRVKTGQEGKHQRPRATGLKPKDLVGIPWRVAFALQADGWYLRSDIIWSKPNPMPESVTDRPTKAHEYLFLLSKSPRYYFDADAVREPHQTPVVDGRFTDLFGRPKKTKTQGDSSVSHADGGPNGMAVIANPAGRNIRSVWTIATQPYPGAHFATFPEGLVEPCVKAGCPDKVCRECGAPWVRETENGRGFDGGSCNGCGRPRAQHVIGGKNRGKNSFGLGKSTTMLEDGAVPCSAPLTTGFRPTCSHDAATTQGVVLDPFAGSGTTGRVANRLSRRAALIDLNAEYLEQAMTRNRDIPLGLETA